MLDEINMELEGYDEKWQKLVAGRNHKEFFENLKPTAVGWKVADYADYAQFCSDLRHECDHVIETWMNGRWIAKMHLKDSKLANGAEIIKIMQRRPGSDDALGLDHVDFYSADPAIEPVLQQETDLKWSRESNDVIAGYDWLSIWFDDTEAKLKSDTVLDIVQAELKELNERLIA